MLPLSHHWSSTYCLRGNMLNTCITSLTTHIYNTLKELALWFPLYRRNWTLEAVIAPTNILNPVQYYYTVAMPETSTNVKMLPESYLIPESIMHWYIVQSPEWLSHSFVYVLIHSTKLSEHSLCARQDAKCKVYKDASIQSLTLNCSGKPSKTRQHACVGPPLTSPSVCLTMMFLRGEEPFPWTIPKGRVLLPI